MIKYIVVGVMNVFWMGISLLDMNTKMVLEATNEMVVPMLRQWTCYHVCWLWPGCQLSCCRQYHSHRSLSHRTTQNWAGHHLGHLLWYRNPLKCMYSPCIPNEWKYKRVILMKAHFELWFSCCCVKYKITLTMCCLWIKTFFGRFGPKHFRE